jgi:hypothetical protein
LAPTRGRSLTLFSLSFSFLSPPLPPPPSFPFHTHLSSTSDFLVSALDPLPPPIG